MITIYVEYKQGPIIFNAYKLIYFFFQLHFLNFTTGLIS